MIEFLYKTTPSRLGMVTDGPTDAERAIVEQHSNYLESLADRGIVLIFGRTQNSGAATFGIVIFRALSKQEAQSIMKDDPAVKHGLMHAELYEYKVAGLNTRDWRSD